MNLTRRQFFAAVAAAVLVPKPQKMIWRGDAILRGARGQRYRITLRKCQEIVALFGPLLPGRSA